MFTEQLIVRQLSQSGYRITRPRRAVIRAILESDSYATPAEVRERARKHFPTVGLVTVYRTLDLLIQLGYARRIHSEDGCHGYAPATHGHRHHLVCRRCGAAIEFDGCDLEPLLDRVRIESGYTIEEHMLELVGLCPTCQ